MIHFHIITLFPDVCKAYTDASILGRAQKKKGRSKPPIAVSYYNPRDFTKDKHKKVDDRPYGGGPGMVMMAEPVLRAWQKAVGKKIVQEKNQKKVKTLIMSPRGKKFDQKMAKKLSSSYEHIVVIAGRYEGIDSRVKKALRAEEVSVGDYVLSGGELPALTIVDATARTIPGVLGKYESLEDQRIAGGEMYTRPETFLWKGKKRTVPKVALSGNHKLIDIWRKSN